MRKFHTISFEAMQQMLNQVIIGEVKSALEKQPGKAVMASRTGHSLCRIVISPNGDYCPTDLAVKKVWLDDKGKLNIRGKQSLPGWAEANLPDYEPEESDWDEEDDLLNITDFQYMLDCLDEQA